MFDATTDPTGAAVQQRARDRRIQQMTDSVSHPLSIFNGPLPDPKWDGLFQAIDEAAGGKKQAGFGYMDQPADDLTRDPNWLKGIGHTSVSTTGLTESNQLGTALPMEYRLKKALASLGPSPLNPNRGKGFAAYSLDD